MHIEIVLTLKHYFIAKIEREILVSENLYSVNADKSYIIQVDII